MAKKKLATILSTAALISSLFSTSAFAAENSKGIQDSGKGALVGLGDSITFGYNLGPTNSQPSPLAFPYLIGTAAHENVIDLGVPGWTTTDLLNALNTNANFQASVKQADKITIDIGSNDLLHLLASTNGNVTPQEVAPILANLQSIIAKVRSLAPNAQIVVYNIYNPFQVSDVQKHALADKLLPEINLSLAGVVASFHDWEIVVADAYSAFGQNQAKYVRPNDIHPTVAGQQKLADIGYADFVATSKGWHEVNGKWYYYTAKGKAAGWLFNGGKWYYLDSNGAMATGWVQVGGKWYYLNASGAMETGWVQVGGKWYYLNASGAMATGWVQVSGKWYYLNASGAMETGWVQVSGKWYYLNASGAMQTGWLKQGKVTYYLQPSGAMVTGWQIIGGKEYYFYSSGKMAVSTIIDGKRIGIDGAAVSTPTLPVTITSKSWVVKNSKVDINLNYPVVTIKGNASLQASLNQQIKDYVTKVYNDTVSSSLLSYPSQGTVTYTVETNKHNILSLLLTVYEYSGGAAHGMASYVPFNIDVRTGKVIKLSDLFTPGTKYLSQINQNVSSQLNSRNLTQYLFNPPFTGIQNQDEFYLKDHSLVVYFSEYEFLPYVFGMPQFEMPYSSLKGIKLPN